MEKHTCPHCGGDISQEIEAAFKERSARGGSAKTEKQIEAHKEAMSKARAAANSPERLEQKRESMAKARAARMAKMNNKKE